MGSQWSDFAPFLDKFYLGIIMFMAVLLVVCLIRAILGPNFTDRIVAANMMGTMVMVIIATLALKLSEGYILDICLLYALLSFLTVVVVSGTYLRAFYKKKIEEEKEDTNNGSN